MVSSAADVSDFADQSTCDVCVDSVAAAAKHVKCIDGVINIECQ